MNLAVFALVVSLAGRAHARTDRRDRHPEPSGAVRLPVGVPEGYVFTHNGFFHPSCVYQLQPGEVFERDVIRGSDGAEQDEVPACSYLRYDYRGNVATGSRVARRRAGGAGPFRHGTLDDGWLEMFDSRMAVPTGSSLTGTWYVPATPTTVSDQDVAFFNYFETPRTIVQPVLDWNGDLPGKWVIQSEMSADGNDVMSAFVVVNPGDVIQGTITASNCDASKGTCASWDIVTTDVTTGESTSLAGAMIPSGEVVDDVGAAALETYNLNACDKLPASGEVVFSSTFVTSPAGAVEPVNFTGYTPGDIGHIGAEVPLGVAGTPCPPAAATRSFSEWTRWPTTRGRAAGRTRVTAGRRPGARARGSLRAARKRAMMEGRQTAAREAWTPA